MKKLRRFAAGALAAAMLMTGALAVSASAAVSQDYVDARKSVTKTSDAAKFYTTYAELIQKYPTSPELYYERAVYRWDWDETVTKDNTVRQQVIADLDQAFGLALQEEYPYQEKPYRYYDYASDAASYKVDLYQNMMGAQEKVMEAEQQYLDALDRWNRICLNGELADGSDREWLERELNQEIPAMRAELNNIRNWYANGSKSYTAWATAGTDPYYEDGSWYQFKVTGSAGSKTVKISAIMGSGTPHEHVYTFSQPVQAVQRSLHGVTFFVPKGTKVQVQDGTKDKDSYIGVWGSKKYTFELTLNDWDYSSSGQGDDFTAAPYIVQIVRV